VTPLRVLVVERAGESVLADLVRATAGTELIAVATTGAQAIAQTQRLRPDAVLMSSAISAQNASATTREIMTLAPAPVIVVIEEPGAAAERARANVLAAGAMATPAALPRAASAEFGARAQSLIETMHAVAAVPLVRRRPARPAARPQGRRRRGDVVVAIGASTGGPAALHGIFAAMPPGFGAPILVTQHIAAGFTTGMVGWLDAAGPLHVKLAEHGELLQNATVYVAVDDRHLTVSADHAIALTDMQPSGGHRPSATIMFRSVAERFAARTYAVILTGMGRDGVDGLTDVRRAGGTIYAQDEASCAVFGMPKAAIDAGVVDLVLPLEAIPNHLAEAVAAT
jgi:two-component system, chemotaxis family, protein-glutamate methylesterase/glutaminase